MSTVDQQRSWTEYLADVIPGRVAKPRLSGLTMVIDTGVPMTAMRDLFELAAPHIDYWKFGFGSAAVCSSGRIADKVSLCQEYDVRPYPGGTAFEIAFLKDRWRPYLEALLASGIRLVEISDGTVPIPSAQRREAIHTAVGMGFQVLTEVGKKTVGVDLPVDATLRQIHQDLRAGAAYVVVEARESGVDIGIYDSEGHVREDTVDALVRGVEPLANRLIWEAPRKEQQVYHLRRFGHKVNLGNIQPLEVIALECLRRGLRGDTLADALPPAPAPEPVEPANDETTQPKTKGVSPTLWVDKTQRGKKYRRPDL